VIALFVQLVGLVPDEARLVLLPLIAVVARYLGVPVWEDGSVG
jgi:hypothetical protein